LAQKLSPFPSSPFLSFLPHFTIFLPWLQVDNLPTLHHVHPFVPDIRSLRLFVLSTFTFYQSLLPHHDFFGFLFFVYARPLMPPPAAFAPNSYLLVGHTALPRKQTNMRNI
jgi:hypothetical protein